jgi:hypothetical protein
MLSEKLKYNKFNIPKITHYNIYINGQYSHTMEMEPGKTYNIVAVYKTKEPDISAWLSY